MLQDYDRDVDFEQPVIVGDTLSQEFIMVDRNLQPYDLTNCRIWFTIKRDPSDDDEDAIAQGYTDVHTNVAGGLSVVDLDIPADAPLGRWYYDSQITISSGRKYTFKRGRLELDYEITKS